MKRSDIEKRLKQDLQAATPSDFQTLRARCGLSDTQKVTESELVAETEYGEACANTRTGKGRVRFRIVALLLALALAAAGIFVAAMKWRKKDDFGLSFSAGYFILDINPSVEISYDDAGKVTDAVGLNEDGEVLLYNVNLLGEDYEAAATTVFERCVKLGYFSAQRTDNAMLVSATNTAGEKDETMTSRIKAVFDRAFVAKKLLGVVITGVQDPTLNAEAEKYGVDGQKYALILDYLQLGGTLDESEYAKIPIRELYAKIAALEAKAEAEQIAALEEQKRIAETVLFATAADKIASILDGLNDALSSLQTGGNVGERSAPPGEQPNGGHGGEGTDARRKEYYEGHIDNLERLADQIEAAKTAGECQTFIKEVLSILDVMRKDERGEEVKAILNNAYEAIESVFVEFESMLAQLETLSATAEEKHAARSEKYGEASDADGEAFDVENWQKENEDDFASSWYERKNQWNADRRQDLKN